jgi:hypothetical protein
VGQFDHLKMKPAVSSETFMGASQTARCHNPENHTPNELHEKDRAELALQFDLYKQIVLRSVNASVA